MKKSVKLKRKTVKLIVKNLIVLLVLAFVAFAGVLSWFKRDQEADSSGISVSAMVGDGLEYYIMPPSANDQYSAINTRLSDNVTYNAQNPNETPRRTSWHQGSELITFDYTDQEFKFMEDVFLCDVTGDGSTFKIPKLMQYDEVAYVDTTQSFDPATANDEYMSFDMYFRSENSRSVKLVFDSSILPNVEYNASTYPYNSATYNEPGDTKKEAAVGAVRMSLLNMEANGERELLWIPGASYYYNGVSDTLTTGLTSSNFSDKGAAYYNGSAIALRSGEGTNDHAYYSAPDSRQVIRSSQSGQSGVGNVVASGSNGQLGSSESDDIIVLTLNNYDSTNGYYYGHIRINLWVEGEDAEARLGFVGGKFNMMLHFALD